jgi:hypothetical protein
LIKASYKELCELETAFAVDRACSLTVRGVLQVLSQLKGLVQEHISLVQQLSTLRGVTEHMTSNSAVPFANQKADFLYTVELLDFRIQ